MRIYPIILLTMASLISSFAAELPYLFPQADSPDFPIKTWLKTIFESIPPSTPAPQGMPPLVLFDGLSTFGDDPVVLHQLRERGLTPNPDIRTVTPQFLHALQDAGFPIILSGRRSFDFPQSNLPYSLNGNSQDWAHVYSEDKYIPERWKQLPCPAIEKGWVKEAQALQQQFLAYKNAGIHVNAVWLDYESEPSVANFDAIKSCQRCRASLHPEILTDEATFQSWRRTRWIQLTSQYIAQPIREIFPDCSVTNWSYTLATESHPVLDWHGHPRPHSGPNHLSATNPVAYGVDTAFIRKAEVFMPFDHREVDWLYTQAVLGQIFADTRNRIAIAPEMRAVPWVSRWVTHGHVGRLPMMSRAAYRECLRHIWLNGIGGMQVFNPRYAGYTQLAIQEVEDAVSVYRELFEIKEFILNGTPLVPHLAPKEKAAVVYSGLVLGDTAIVRASSFDNDTHTVTVEVFPGILTEIIAPPQGCYYRINKKIRN